ncbi:LEAF RUST 10 DISEASE-RESISTANCE LOCUS RECEPTOR-LIKE PROTEIN KINASE-like 2.2 [Mercurialis annua]|uniref:LEAF RUST 10 DISEASE-RESISTANCE LOCUS RECEPTOR-LIKE PROTEIN KINASE-like 2.2 n=1 Tax=Mercurialis annua TaxID=3986 RepID=UPI0024AEEDCA|nr:LEAF RUST 10 DISEASE-RESISTANCE LOCUS RECEPTOR-LIKE PROTEIN KINASE-like 2.2 [Mercurialis annua]
MFSLILIVLLQVPNTCDGRNTINRTPCISSCGNIRNISHPFRLKSDPKQCGYDNSFELSCENNLTILPLNSVKYQVQAIDYFNQTIRLKDPNVNKDNCSSIPLHSWADHYSNNFVRYGETISLLFLKCTNSVNDPLYVDASACIDSIARDSGGGGGGRGGYWYVKVGLTYASELVDLCRIELITLTSWPQLKDLQNISYLNVHDSMAYGFEVGWGLTSDFYCINVGAQCLHRPGGTLLNFVADVFGFVDALLFRILTPATIVPRFDAYIRQEPVYRITSQGKPLPPAALLCSYNNETQIRPSCSSTSDDIPICSPVLSCHSSRCRPVLYRIVLFICGAPCTFAFLMYIWHRRHLSMYDNVEEFLQSQANFMPLRYSYSDIRKITNGFKDKLGEGGFGSVYKGKLRSGRLAAIKMLDKSKSNGNDFISEVGTIGKVHHVNVVHLLGFSVERSHRALVYEFMANGSLDKFVFSQEHEQMLSIEKMHEISLGIARGIEYLHRGCDMQILHFDIKPHNILLDENFIPKISDFGLAKLYPTNNNTVPLTAARGTIGYMAPELIYKNIGSVSYKADVYSFGMLLMEMAGRRKNLNAFAEHLSQIYFPSWAYDQYNEGNDLQLGDATEQEKSITKKMIMVALWCIQLKPIDRPAMNKVIEMLESEVNDIEMPPKPALSLLDHAE